MLQLDLIQLGILLPQKELWKHFQFLLLKAVHQLLNIVFLQLMLLKHGKIKEWNPFIRLILKLQNVIHLLLQVFGSLLNLQEQYHQNLMIKENFIVKLDLILQ